MPFRNPHAGFVTEALDSVFAQTTGRWELLVVDDGSDDRAATAVLSALGARRDPRVRIAASASPHVTGALNTGMRLAGTPFVCTLHCDDLLAEHALEVLNRAIETDPGVDYFHSSFRHIDEAGRPLGGIRAAKHLEGLDAFLSGSPIKHLHCWRVSAALAIGGMDESFGPHGGDDYDFAWSMAEAGCVFRPLQECLYLYRDHREHYRLTTHVPLEVQTSELMRIFAKHGVPEERARAEVARRRYYLREALYVTEDDRRRKEASGFDPRTGWRRDHDRPASF
jgi:glycosyltransferase involved in cell wall biosynthesis